MSSTDEVRSAGKLLADMGTDGEAWAREFSASAVRVATEVLDPDTEGRAVNALIARLVRDCAPGSWLHGWFCNAIEAGRSAGQFAPVLGGAEHQ